MGTHSKEYMKEWRRKHPSYYEPLNVQFLCVNCHRGIHRKN